MIAVRRLNHAVLFVSDLDRAVEFYQRVFAQAVRDARAKGESYESMRDRLRRRWKPARTATERASA